MHGGYDKENLAVNRACGKLREKKGESVCVCEVHGGQLHCTARPVETTSWMPQHTRKKRERVPTKARSPTILTAVEWRVDGAVHQEQHRRVLHARSYDTAAENVR